VAFVTEQAFELVGLTKVFGDEKAVDDLSLAVPKGSFGGLAGSRGLSARIAARADLAHSSTPACSRD
jgi:ABC-type uncharacterized transport system ATPase subunit